MVDRSRPWVGPLQSIAVGPFQVDIPNAFGDGIKTTNPEGQVKGYSTTFVPDKLGRTVTVNQPPARAAGDLEAQPWQKLPTSIHYAFDGVGNLISVKQPTGTAGNTEVRYTFWPTNQLKTETDSFDDPNTAHQLTEYDYDKEGRQKLRKDSFDGAEKRRTEWEHFADGTLKFETSTGADMPTHRTGFEYDQDNNLKVVKTADNTSNPVAANISQILADYTSKGELEKVTETIYPPGGGAAQSKVSSFNWERDGVIGSHTIDGQTSTFDHRLDRMETKFTPFGGQGEFTANWYDNGDLNNLTMPNGSTITQTYDPAARLRSRMVEAAGTNQSSWSNIEYDDNDNRLSELTSQLQPAGASITNRTGTADYSYDQLDRLIRFKHPFDQAAVSYGLDHGGNIITEAGDPNQVQGFRPFNYNYTNNRLTSRAPQPAGDTLAYAYDQTGNQTTETEGTQAPTVNTYDAASHPAKTTKSNGDWAAYTYDGLGRMVTRTSNTPGDEATLFFHFGMKDQIALETNAAGTPSRRYLINSFGAPLGQTLGDGSGRSYFVPDLRGNMSQLLGPSDVKGVFAYDPYGKAKETLDEQGQPASSSLTQSATGWDSRLRFQMAPQDKLTGNYNLGPRLLNPSINRFVGADFYAAGASNMALQVDPLTGNRYLYAGANPAGLIDNGHFGEVPCSVKKFFGKSCEATPAKAVLDMCIVPGEVMDAIRDECWPPLNLRT